MKLRNLIALTCAAGIMLTQTAAFASAGGSGTAAAPYKISSAADFTDIAHNPSGSYVLERSITVYDALTDTNFTGVLDGNGYDICNSSGAPLFGAVSGTVKNTLFTTPGTVYPAVLTSTLYGSVTECTFDGSIYGNSADAPIGGIAAVINGGSVLNCAVTTGLNSAASTAGAIAGTVTNASILNCFVDSKINVSGSAAPAIGTAVNSQISDVYYNADRNPNIPYGISVGSDVTTAVNSSNMYTAAAYTGLAFGSVWTIIEGKHEPMLVSCYGMGTADKPYRIHCEKDMGSIVKPTEADSKYYTLANNIANSFNDIGTDEAPFNGHFDGANHYMKYRPFYVIGETGVAENVVRISDYSATAGISYKNYGTISNCHVAGYLHGTKDTGGIAGENIGGTICDCSFDGSVVADETGAGGIVGYNSYGTIERCYSNASVSSGDHSAGGIVGDNSYGIIRNCAAEGSVKSKATEAGGIAGRLYNGSILSSYSTCTVSGQDSKGGIYGLQIENGYVESSYYLIKEDNSQGMDENQTASYGKNDLQMRDASTYSGFDFNGVWAAADSYPALRSVYGSGTKDNPYILRTIKDMKKIRSDKECYYRLESDISLDGVQFTAFKGVLDGNGHAIYNKGTSLFGKIESGSYIGNLYIYGCLAKEAEDSVIEYCSADSGELIYTLNNCTVRNCGTYKASSGGSIAGGFADQITGGRVTDCAVVNANVSGSNLGGGFVGMTSGAVIENCFVYNTSVIGKGSGSGGFVGRHDKGSYITNCSSTGTVTGGQAGAFVGLNYASISTSTGLNTLSDGTAAPFDGYSGGTPASCTTYASGDTYRIINTGGTGMAVNVPVITAAAPAAQQTATLTDISGHWAEATIRKLVDKKVVSGYDDGTYRPQNPVTKGEFIKLLLTALKTNIGDGFTDYGDVNKHWAKNYVYTAINAGVCANINESANTFGVDKAITRAEAVALMGRMLSNGETGTPSFTDNAAIPAWAINEVALCVQKGLITGMEDGSFAPNNSLTRAEAAVIIDRVSELK